VRFAATLLLAFTLASTAHAQIPATWKGLHFGQTRTQVRAQLAAEGFVVETSQEGALQSVANYLLLLPGTRRTLPLRADFHFTDDGGLMDIVLSLDFPAMRRANSDLGGDDLLLAFASERLNRALTDKYGIPVLRRPECDADAATLAKQPTAFCATNWRDLAQSVELNWLAHPQRLFIRYQMLAPDL
jgi:hypothetical protein